MFPMHPDHHMLIAKVRRHQLERDAEIWRLVRDASSAAEPAADRAALHRVRRRGRLLVGRFPQLWSPRRHRTRRLLALASCAQSIQCIPDKGEN